MFRIAENNGTWVGCICTIIFICQANRLYRLLYLLLLFYTGSHWNVTELRSENANCGRFLYSAVIHHSDVIMSAIVSQITSLTIVYSIVYSGAGQRKHQNFASLAFVQGIPRWPVNSPHKWPVTRKMLPFDDAVMYIEMVCRYQRMTSQFLS